MLDGSGGRGVLDLSDALSKLYQTGGSDLLLSVGTPPRMRCDGELREVDGRPLSPSDTEFLLRGVLSSDQWRTLEKVGHVDFAFTSGDGVRVRANAYRQRETWAAAFRLLPIQIPSMEALGIPDSVRRMISQHQGLVLVTGPTGSGKSTSLAAVIEHLNTTRPCHIITVEDPIEYVHQHRLAIVDQREVGRDVATFADALRVVFREDPDVVLIGEMRDLETIAAALTIAETGHLVLATLHTNDASQAVDRILDVFPAGLQDQARAQLSACLTGVVYQQLVPAVGGGRIAAFEVLVATHAVRALIKGGKANQIRNVIQTSLQEGSQTLERALSALVQDGTVTLEAARTKSLYPHEITV
ncbi:MAG: type IV pilus twitching motility protein PilT [Actinobacteria bacterium]|nr:type IV pilus twitching motility protein PilT [Actinomycetota bacterium]